MRKKFRHFRETLIEHRVWGLCFCFGWLGALLPLRRFWNYESLALELGQYTQLLWGWIHGGTRPDMASVLNLHLPLTLGILPFFFIFPRPETLIVLQSMVLATGGAALYYLARLVFPKSHLATRLLPFLYWGCLASLGPFLPIFGGAVWFLPLFLWGMVGVCSRRKILRPRSFKSSFPNAWIPFAVASVAIVVFWMGPFHKSSLQSLNAVKHARWLGSVALPCINFDSALATSEILAPHLTSRPWVSVLPNLHQSQGELVDCIVQDSTFDSEQENYPTLKKRLQEFSDSGFHEAWRCQEFRVFERGMAGCLRCVPECL